MSVVLQLKLPLAMAAEEGLAEIVRLLLQRGAKGNEVG
jgi:ankyrin repeat protein